METLMRLKNSQEAAKYRNELLLEQNFIDPIIQQKITKGSEVLDHAHFGSQRCRAVLAREVNSFEGKVANAYTRYMTHLTDKPLSEILRNLADYLEMDNSLKPIHHTALTKDVKAFSRLSSAEQCAVLDSFGISAGSNNKARALQIRPLIRDGRYKR